MIDKEQILNLLNGKPSNFMEAISESLSDKADKNVLEESKALAINLFEMTPGHKKMVGDALKGKTDVDTGADETGTTKPKATVNGAAGGTTNGKTARPQNPSKDDDRDAYNQLNDFDSSKKGKDTNFVGKKYTTNERALRSESKEEYSEDGRGKYKVTYIHPNKKNIGNDRFETKEQAVHFANSLKKKGYHDVHLSEEIESLDEAGNALNKLKKNAALTMMGKFKDRENVESGPKIIDKAMAVSKSSLNKKGEQEKNIKHSFNHLVGKDAMKSGRGANKFNQRVYSAFIGKTKVVNDTSNAKELNDKISGIKKKGKNPSVHVESEQIDELSKATLHSYADKAMLDQKKRARDWIANGEGKDLRKFNNRSQGITRAYFNRHSNNEEVVMEGTWLDDLKKSNPKKAADYAIVGNQSTANLRKMVKALSMHSWGNTAEDNKRLEAAKRILKNKY